MDVRKMFGKHMRWKWVSLSILK